MNNLFRRLFRKKTPVSVVVDSEALELNQSIPQREDTSEVTESVTGGTVQFVVGSAHSVGVQRDHNEDALFALNTVLVEGEEQYPLGIFIVADGMGGHQHGEVASGETVRTMAAHLSEEVMCPALRKTAQSVDLQEILIDGVEKVQQVVVDRVPGGGTTLTVALILGNQISFVHVGDSRAYFIHRDQTIEVITHDHSLVQRLQDLGQLSEEDAMAYPHRNVLIRAIGQGETFQPDFATRTIPIGGYLLICSDGLWGVVPETKLLEIIFNSPNPGVACNRLVDAANDLGGPDNISAVLVQFLQ